MPDNLLRHACAGSNRGSVLPVSDAARQRLKYRSRACSPTRMHRGIRCNRPLALHSPTPSVQALPASPSPHTRRRVPEMRRYRRAEPQVTTGSPSDLLDRVRIPILRNWLLVPLVVRPHSSRKTHSLVSTNYGDADVVGQLDPIRKVLYRSKQCQQRISSGQVLRLLQGGQQTA